jgi:hypothetical protein
MRKLVRPLLSSSAFPSIRNSSLRSTPTSPPSELSCPFYFCSFRVVVLTAVYTASTTSALSEQPDTVTFFSAPAVRRSFPSVSGLVSCSRLSSSFRVSTVRIHSFSPGSPPRPCSLSFLSSVIFYYGTTFFERSGISNPFLITIATNVVNVGMTFPGIWAVDKLGRRKTCVAVFPHSPLRTVPASRKLTLLLATA